MKISAHYTTSKKILTVLIWIITFALCILATAYFHFKLGSTLLTFIGCISATGLPFVTSWLHYSSYFRMSNHDLYFHENPPRYEDNFR